MKKIAVLPNLGARLGHQFTEWLRVYIFCKDNGYTFYYYPFLPNSTKDVNTDFLNLSYGEELFKNYRGTVISVREMSLPQYLMSDSDDLYLFDFNLPNEGIGSLRDLDDDIRDILRDKYFLINEKCPTDSISVHIRRDDVTEHGKWRGRYIKIGYYVDVLRKLYEEYPSFEVKIFAYNVDSSFYDIQNIPFEKVSLHINENLQSTLNRMINSKILVTSNSGISFIASILSDKSNIKISPPNFWHTWPEETMING